MDIAKIRKKLKEAKEQKKAELAEQSEPLAEEAPPEVSKETLSVSEETPQVLEETSPIVPAKEPVESPAEAVEIEEIEDNKDEASLAPKEEEPPSPPEPETAPPVLSEGLPDEVEQNIVELLTFRLGNEEYAFRVSDIEEILRPQRYAAVPRTEDFILGVTSLRGKIIPLVDLKTRLNLKKGSGGEKAKILILKGPKGSIGALVDRVIDVIRVSENEIKEPPGNLSETEARFIEGVTLAEGRFISVMKMDEVLNFSVAL